MGLSAALEEIEILKLSCNIAQSKLTDLNDHIEYKKYEAQKEILNVLKRKLEARIKNTQEG